MAKKDTDNFQVVSGYILEAIEDEKKIIAKLQEINTMLKNGKLDKLEAIADVAVLIERSSHFEKTIRMIRDILHW